MKFSKLNYSAWINLKLVDARSHTYNYFLKWGFIKFVGLSSGCTLKGSLYWMEVYLSIPNLKSLCFTYLPDPLILCIHLLIAQINFSEMFKLGLYGAIVMTQTPDFS